VCLRPKLSILWRRKSRRRRRRRRRRRKRRKRPSLGRCFVFDLGNF
jgi:hypothetical protein